MKKLILSAVFLSLFFLLFPLNVSAQPLLDKHQLAKDKCVKKKYDECNQKFKSDVCLPLQKKYVAWTQCQENLIDKIKACNKEIDSEYPPCKEASGTTPAQGQTSSSQRNEILNIELDKIKNIEIEIMGCGAPFIPSDNPCVLKNLNSLPLPDYLKEVIEMDQNYTNPQKIQDTQDAQIVGTDIDIKLPKTFSNPYTNPTDYSSTLPALSKKVSKTQFILALVDTSTSVSSPSISTLGESLTFVEDSGPSSMFIPPTKESSSPFRYEGGWKNLVTLDRDAIPGEVGDPAANRITAVVLDPNAKVTLLDQAKQSVMEISRGAKIVVAGVTQSDTVEAARDFVSLLAK